MTLIQNIKGLYQIREQGEQFISGNAMKELPMLENAWLLIKKDSIADYGSMDSLPDLPNATVIDASGKLVLPAWCDSHSHLVFAGNREGEFVARINGATYQEIAAAGGGILNSAKKLQDTPEEALFEQSAARLEAVMKLGTGALEIKSGYGLTLEAELKMLRVAKNLGTHYPIAIKTSFLGAHAVPKSFKSSGEYIDHIVTNMLPEIADSGLADYVDIFCEDGYFSVADTKVLLVAAAKYGLRPKIHVNQFNAIGGVAAGVNYNALSVDHLELITQEDINVLKGSTTMPVALPGCSYFLSIPYTPARQIIDAGLPLALATDYNPGSAPSGNMNFVVATACIKMKMTPEEAINAATLNGAYAMGLQDTHGSITRGKKANLIITKPVPSLGFLPYSFGSDLIEQVVLNGKNI